MAPVGPRKLMNDAEAIYEGGDPTEPALCHCEEPEATRRAYAPQDAGTCWYGRVRADQRTACAPG